MINDYEDGIATPPYSAGAGPIVPPITNLAFVELFRLSGTPIQTFELVGQDGSFRLSPWRQCNLKWVALNLSSKRTKQGQSHTAII